MTWINLITTNGALFRGHDIGPPYSSGEKERNKREREMRRKRNEKNCEATFHTARYSQAEIFLTRHDVLCVRDSRIILRGRSNPAADKRLSVFRQVLVTAAVSKNLRLVAAQSNY